MNTLPSNFSSIPRDGGGHISPPVLVLQTRHGQTIGPLGLYSQLTLELKYNELSTGSFELPASVEGEPVPFYDRVVRGAAVHIAPYGVFLIHDCEVRHDGVSEIKKVTLRSREYELNNKNLVFAAGTYRLYDPVAPGGTLLGMALETARQWHIGAVDAALWTRHRTFDDTNTGVLDFLLTQAQAAYGCVFVFDTETRTIDVRDAAAEVRTLPIYLSAQNLLDKVTVKDSSQDIATVLNVSGAAPLTIREVNPIGSSNLYELGYYIQNGDIPAPLAARYRAWKQEIRDTQPAFKNLVALRAAAYARYAAEQAARTELQKELAVLDNLRAVLTQQLASETDAAAREALRTRLAGLSTQYTAQQAKITEQDTRLLSIKNEYESHSAALADITGALKPDAYFTAGELDVLDSYMIEQDFCDPSFAVFEVDIAGTGDSHSGLDGAALTLRDVTLRDVTVAGGTHRIFDLTGGTLSLADADYALDGGLVRATLDSFQEQGQTGNTLVLSAYLDRTRICAKFATLADFPATGEADRLYLAADTGKIYRWQGGGTPGYAETTEPATANVTLSFSGSAAVFDPDALLAALTPGSDTYTDEAAGVTYTDHYYTGTLAISALSGSVYVTRSVSDYQELAVAQELYDYAEQQLKKLAYPAYTFEVDAGNFIWDAAFRPFSDALELGCGIYLQLSDRLRLTPVLLEVHLDFEAPDRFSLVFSNEFQRRDRVKSMQELIQSAASTSRSFDMSRYLDRSYTSGGAGALADFLKSGMTTAYGQTVTAGAEQEVRLDGAGLSVGAPGSGERIVISNGMIALVDDANRTSRMAMGHFYNDSSGTDYYGIVADLIGGTLLAGQNLHMECAAPSGEVTQFRFDGTGAFLNNSRLYLQSTAGGRMGLDPNYGLYGGSAALFDVTDTGFIRPSFIDEDGDVLYGSDGFPKDVNFWLGINGDAWFKGTVYATGGSFTGDVYARNFFFQDGDDVKTLLSQSQKKISADYLDLMGLNVVNDAGDTVLSIDQTGIKFASNYSPIRYQYASSASGPWHDVQLSADKYRRESFDGGMTWGTGYQFIGTDGHNGSNANVTWDTVRSALSSTAALNASVITIDSMGSPNIYGGNIYGSNIYAGNPNDAGSTSSDYFAKMSSTGFEIYRYDITQPKMSLYVNEEGSLVSMRLGAGGNSSDTNIFEITKDTSSARCLYTTPVGEQVGFVFKSDGEIEVKGTLSGVSAVFS